MNRETSIDYRPLFFAGASGFFSLDSLNERQPLMASEPHKTSLNFSPMDSASLNYASSDKTAVLEVGKGNEEAILLLYDRYSSLILSVATHVLHDFASGEEVVQDVFLNLWNNPGAFNPLRGTLRGWLITVARHRAIDYLRRRRNEVELHDGDVSGHGKQCNQAECAELLGKVKQVMRAMPAEQREVFEMAYFQGMTHVEISGRTGMPLGTVKSRIRLAMGSIRKILAAQAA